jgi:hypothetical protein
MTAMHLRPIDRPMPRPAYVWVAVGLELFTALGAIPVGIQLLRDPSGAAVGLPTAWIEATPFGSYLVPALYLLLVNGIGMLALAFLSATRHPLAPWLTGVLGTGLLVWIVVQLVLLPETSALQAIFGLVGAVLMGISALWLRASGQLVAR